jgi:hypothetical protein
MTAPGAVPGEGGVQQPSNGMGLAAMILGIASIPLLCCFGIGTLAGIAAIVLGYMGKTKADQGLATNRTQALVGLILGAVAVGLGVLSIILNLTGAIEYTVPTN